MTNVEYCSYKNPECVNPYHENPPYRILKRFFKLNSVENKMQLEFESSTRKYGPTNVYIQVKQMLMKNVYIQVKQMLIQNVYIQVKQMLLQNVSNLGEANVN